MISLKTINTAIQHDQLGTVKAYRQQPDREKSDRAIIWDATYAGAPEIVAFLLDEGQDPNSKELTGSPLLDGWFDAWVQRYRIRATQKHFDNLKAVALELIRHGAHFDVRTPRFIERLKVQDALWAVGGVYNGVYSLPFSRWKLAYRLPGMTNDQMTR